MTLTVPAPEQETPKQALLPPRHPPVDPLLTPAMEAFSRQVRALSGLRTELIVQAQDGPDIMAFEQVLASAHGAALALSAPLGTPETLHWADRALNFRGAPTIDTTWDSTEYTPLGPRHPVWDDAALQAGQAYALNDPLWTHVATGYLLALGFPRSPKVQREIKQARARHALAGGRAFFQLPHLPRPHQSRLLPGVHHQQTVSGYHVCDVPALSASPWANLPPFTPVLALVRDEPSAQSFAGLLAWPVHGPAVPLGPGEDAHALKERLGERGTPLLLDGVHIGAASVRELLARLPEVLPGPEEPPPEGDE